MKTMHLFAGIGGGLLADKILGHEPIVAVEWEPYACQVLRERAAEGWFSGLRVWEGDVRLFDPSEYAGQVDCIHAGFPCQDISVAGKQAGVGEETRSGLYREVLRIARLVRPRYLFLENVAAIVSNGLGTVLNDLAALGYDSEWLCLRAADCGANHLRDRWWLLADSRRRSDEPKRIGRISTGQASSMQREAREQWIWSEAANSGEDVADTKFVGCRQVEQSIFIGAGGEGEPNKVDKSSHAEWRQWWGFEPDVGRVADGVPNRVQRLKGLGNAQVPLQAAVAWRFLGGE